MILPAFLNRIFVTVFAVAVFVAASSQSSGQVSDQQRANRRALVGDLLKQLLESQMQRDPNPVVPGRPNLRPAFPNPNVRQIGPVTPQMVAARGSLQAWENESTQFVNLLRREERRLPAVSPFLADAMSTTAQIQALRANMVRVSSLAPLTDSYCELDAQWRLFSHRLGQVSGLKPECLACLERMAVFNEQLGNQFGVSPQFNRRELQQHCTVMATSFEHLIRDVQYDLRGDPNYASILRDCQSLNTRLHQAVPLIAQGDYDSIVRLYQNSVQQWRGLKYKLAACPSGRIHRNVHAIESAGRHIGDLLWLPVEIDRRYLGLIIDSIQRDADFALQQVSLKQVLSCPSPGLLLNCARDFQQQCQVLSRKMNSNARLESLTFDLRRLSNQWLELNGHLSGFGMPALDQTALQIDSGFQSLQGALNPIGVTGFVGDSGGFAVDGPMLDRESLALICASLDSLSDQLQVVVETQVVSGYDRVFQRQIRDLSAAFHRSAHSMHALSISNRRHGISLQPDIQIAIQHWSELRPLINRCRGNERIALNQLRAQIEPLMVKLQVIYAR